MSKMQRNKGRRGQTAAANLLKDRDWEIIETSAGMKVEDIVATDPQGKRWSIEVKNHKHIKVEEFRKQAIEQAKKRNIDWMLMVKIACTSSWLIWKKNEKPVVWS